MTSTHFEGADRAAGYGIEEDEPVQPIPADTHVNTATADTAEVVPVIENVPELADLPAAPAEPVTATADPGSGRIVGLAQDGPAASPADLLAGLTRASLRASAPPVATTGWRGFLARVGFKPEPSAAEKATLEAAAAVARDEETIRQATYTRPVGILVANRKGSASKTTTALSLGGTLAACRGGGVAIVEVAEDPGTLTLRAEGNPRRGVGQLVADHADIHNPGQLAGYTAPQTSYARVIGSTGPRPALTGDAVRNIVRVVDSHFDMRVMDSGNQYTSPVFTAAVEAADVLVIPTLNARDTAEHALALLDSLREQGGHAAELADRAIVLVLTDGRYEAPDAAQTVAEAFTQARVGEILPIPYDAHLAERGSITLSQLAPDTYRAFVAAGAAVIRALDPVTA